MLKSTQVLGGAYKKDYKGPFLSHVVNTETWQPLCNRVKAEHLDDDEYGLEPPENATCPACQKKLKKV
jgi:hypothetical protein